MKPRPVLALCALSVAASVSGQTPEQNTQPYAFAIDALYRYEWNQNAPDEQVPSRRWLLSLRPRIELGGPTLSLGIGGEFNRSSDKNTELPIGAPTLWRDNYDSRAARLDLAYLRVRPATWIEIQGGRFQMPAMLTEMLWDRDLRPQGAALTLRKNDDTGTFSPYDVTLLWARGSHALDYKHSDLLLAAARVSTRPGPYVRRSRTELSATGSYLGFSRLEELDKRLLRQNQKFNGRLAPKFRVIDLTGRLESTTDLPLEIVADYCWNIEADGNNRGLWLGIALGTLDLSRARGEYTYARIDRDATVAAFNTDDFLWGTGFEGHRGELATRVGTRTSVHLIGQFQKFKDSLDPQERVRWSTRIRLELRATY